VQARERERDQATEKEVLIMFVCLDQAVKSGEKANCMNVSCQCHSRLVFYLMLLSFLCMFSGGDS